jgi:hypothetical protein
VRLVISVEGLRSPKAIAFINSQLEPKNQSILRTSNNQEITQLLQTTNRVDNTLNVLLTENYGDLKWIN